MMKSFFNRVISGSTLVVLAACGTPGLQESADRNVDRAIQDARSVREQARPNSMALLEEDPGAWIATASIPLASDEDLPRSFSGPARFIAAEPVSLPDIADTLNHTLGLSIKLNRDVFQRRQLQTRSLTPSDRDGPNRSGIPGTTTETTVSQVGIVPSLTLSYTGTVRGLLDTIASRTGTHWVYRDGVVEFSRLQTRTFQLKTMPGVSSYSATVGKAASTSESSGGSSGAKLTFGANSSISMSSSLNYWQELLATVAGMLSGEGMVTPSSMTNSVTVTDVPYVIDKVADFIEGENTVLGRQVGLRVQVYSVELTERSQSGVDWSAVYASGSGATFGIAGPSAGAGVGYGRLSANMSKGRFKDSKFVIQSLSQQGRVGTVIDTTVVTLNNQPAPVAVTDNQGYVSETTISAGTLGSPGLASMKQEMLTTGFILNLLPTILDNRSIMLQIQMDLSELKELKQINSDGSEGAPAEGDQVAISRSSVQTPRTSSIQTMQRASLKSGDSLLLTGFRRNVDQSGRNGVIAYEGGTKSAEQRQEEIVIMISPELVEGV